MTEHVKCSKIQDLRMPCGHPCGRGRIQVRHTAGAKAGGSCCRRMSRNVPLFKGGPGQAVAWSFAHDPSLPRGGGVTGTPRPGFARGHGSKVPGVRSVRGEGGFSRPFTSRFRVYPAALIRRSWRSTLAARMDRSAETAGWASE
jgi:hypothetical protein